LFKVVVQAGVGGRLLLLVLVLDVGRWQRGICSGLQDLFNALVRKANLR